MLGKTDAGRYLLVVVCLLGKGKARVVTARDMTHSERHRFNRFEGRY